jgi:PEP-CTERM motif
LAISSLHGKPTHPRQNSLPVQELIIMAKRIVRFPIAVMLLALLSVSIPVLADNIDLASAQPDFDRATALSSLGFNNNSELFSRDRLENTTADGRFISELCSFASEFQPDRDRIPHIDTSWFNRYQDVDYPDFGRSRGKGDFYWRKHPSTVPEPSSLPLLGTGILVIAFSVRKRLH